MLSVLLPRVSLSFVGVSVSCGTVAPVCCSCARLMKRHGACLVQCVCWCLCVTRSRVRVASCGMRQCKLKSDRSAPVSVFCFTSVRCRVSPQQTNMGAGGPRLRRTARLSFRFRAPSAPCHRILCSRRSALTGWRAAHARSDTEGM